jgi:hypothetical protein
MFLVGRLTMELLRREVVNLRMFDDELLLEQIGRRDRTDDGHENRSEIERGD